MCPPCFFAVVVWNLLSRHVEVSYYFIHLMVDCLLISSLISHYICLFINICIRPFIHSFIHLSIHSFVHSFIRPFIRPLIHSSIHSFVPSFIRPFIHSTIHSFICPLMLILGHYTSGGHSTWRVWGRWTQRFSFMRWLRTFSRWLEFIATVVIWTR